MEQQGADGAQQGTLSLRMNRADLSSVNLPESPDSEVGTNGTQVKVVGDVVEFELDLQGEDGKKTRITAFEQPITVTFRVDPEEKGRLGVYYIGDKGELEYVGGKRNGDAIEAQLRHFSKYAVLHYEKAYSDVSAEHWAHDVIEDLSARLIVEGTSGAAFMPNQAVTRAETVPIRRTTRQLGGRLSTKLPFPIGPLGPFKKGLSSVC